MNYEKLKVTVFIEITETNIVLHLIVAVRFRDILKQSSMQPLLSCIAGSRSEQNRFANSMPRPKRQPTLSKLCQELHALR